MSGKISGTLFVVATPIGNLEDLTPRARRKLAEVDLVAAEDTRHTGRLLSHIGCKPRLLALHDHNEERLVGRLIKMLLDGESIALVSDAGTPLVSDPGYRLVCAAHENGVTVSPIPGASAVTAALSVAGLPTDRFCFEGFAPSKRAARREWLAALARESRTLVIYESVHRIRPSLADMAEIFGADRQAFIGRELTKMHEQCVQESLGSLLEKVTNGSIIGKGEFVIVISGADDESDPGSSLDINGLLLELSRHNSVKDVVKIAARLTGEKRNALYERLVSLKGADT